MDRDQATKAYVDTTGLPFVKQMEIIAPGDGRNQATVEAFEERKRLSLLEFDLFPDALGAVTRIRQHGIKVCVSSGNKEELVVRLLEFRGLEVDLVMGFRPGFEKGLDHFSLAMETFGTVADRLLFVGDSVKDGHAARAAGIRFVARTGLLTAEELSEALPGVAIINSLDDVLPLVGIKGAQEDRWADATS